MIALALLAGGLLIAVNAVFVATEFALVASRTHLLEEAAEGGDRGAVLALRARSDLRRQLSGAQLGITVSSVLLGILAEPSIGDLVAPALDRLQMPSGVTETVGWLLALGTAAVLQMLLGELVPKNVAIAEPERTLRRLAPVHNVVVAVLRPAIWVLDRLAGLAVRPFGYTPVDEIEHAIGAPELSTMIDASRRAGFIEESEHGLLAGALDLGSRTVASVMVPRRAVVTVGRRMTLAEIEEVIVASGRSRLPVAAAGGDDLLGMFHVKDLLRLPPEAQDDPVPLELIRRMLVVAPEELLDDVLLRMRGARSHLAVVRDAGGMTVGIVSMEDVVEELVGDIRDESDLPDA